MIIFSNDKLHISWVNTLNIKHWQTTCLRKTRGFIPRKERYKLASAVNTAGSRPVKMDSFPLA